MSLRGAGIAVLLCAALAACAPLPPGRGQEASWQASPNFDQRRPNFVVLHHTTNSTLGQALGTLTDPRRMVSAHYLIGRDGQVVQLVDEFQRAWHAGDSWWGGVTDLNSASLGIELDNTGDEAFAEPQIEALLALLADLRARHRIPSANILGHGDVAPGRKIDPSRHFPWARLAAQGFGLWCEKPLAAAPVGFDSLLGLQALGYSVLVPSAARAAFRRHYAGSDEAGELDADELGLLQCLLQRKATQTD